MATPVPDSDGAAFLDMATKLRLGLTQRDEFVKPYRQRFDRSRDDMRMGPEKRIGIARDFLHAVQRADYIYDQWVGKAMDDYRRALTGDRELSG